MRADQDVINQWLHSKSENTRDAYRRDIEQFQVEIGSKPFGEVELADVQAFADYLIVDYAVSSQARKLAAVKSLFKFAHEQGHLSRNVATLIRLPKVKDNLSQRILSEGEVLRMIHLEPAPSVRAMLKLFYAGALRVSELCGLKWSDCQERDDGRAQLTVFGKGEKTRPVLIPKELWRELKTLQCGASPPSLIFGLNRHAAYRLVRAAAERAGIDKVVSPHWMGHAHISHALDRGCPVHIVRETAGHASLATMTKYAHARPDQSSSSYLAL